MVEDEKSTCFLLAWPSNKFYVGPTRINTCAAKKSTKQLQKFLDNLDKYCPEEEGIKTSIDLSEQPPN